MTPASIAAIIVALLGVAAPFLQSAISASHASLIVSIVSAIAVVASHVVQVFQPAPGALKAAKATAVKIAGGMLLCACGMTTSQTSAIEGGGASVVACVVTEIAKGDDTFEGIAAACGAKTVAEIVGIVETLAYAPPDAGGAPSLSLKAAKVAHVRSGK